MSTPFVEISGSVVFVGEKRGEPVFTLKRGKELFEILAPKQIVTKMARRFLDDVTVRVVPYAKRYMFAEMAEDSK